VGNLFPYISSILYFFIIFNANIFKFDGLLFLKGISECHFRALLWRFLTRNQTSIWNALA